MDPRARVVAIVVSLLLAAGAGYAIGAVTDDDTSPAGAAVGAPDRPRGDSPPSRSGPESDAGAADEYELKPNIPPAGGDG